MVEVEGVEPTMFTTRVTRLQRVAIATKRTLPDISRCTLKTETTDFQLFPEKLARGDVD